MGSEIQWEAVKPVDAMNCELRPGDIAIVARNNGWRGLVLEPCVVIEAINGRRPVGQKDKSRYGSRYSGGRIKYARFEYRIEKGRRTDNPARKNMTLHCQDRFVKVDRSSLNLTNALHVKTLELAKEVESEYVRSIKN